MGLFLSCSEAVALLTDYQEGALSWVQKFRLRIHIFCCPLCRTFLASLQAIPALVHRTDRVEQSELQGLAESALAKAMGRLGEAPAPRELPPPSVPEALRANLASDPDLPLRLQAEVAQDFSQGVPRDYPYFPERVMAQLPPPERWTWHTSGGIRATTLVEDPAGFRLRLMQVLPDLRIPMHTHLGTESILVLDGELEDGEALLTDGQWIFHDRGSCHAPQILEAGCWCLVREEGAVEFHSPMARLRAWLSRAA